MSAWIKAAMVTAFLLGSVLPGFSKEIHFYTDPKNGNDSHAGTSIEKAFRTIKRTIAEVEKIASTANANIVVNLRGGDYFIDSTLRFTDKISGSGQNLIVFQAYKNESPVISGGENLSGGWKLVDQQKNIYKKAGVSGSFRQLYVNGQWGIRARYPNLTEASTGAGYLTAVNSKVPFEIEAKEIGSWAKNGVCEFVFIEHWSQNRCRIEDYNVSGNTVTVQFKLPEAKFDHSYHLQQTTYFYFENAYELIDAEGEWFLDEQKHELYYKPRSNENMETAQVICPRVERLISIEGKQQAVKNLQFKGITFKHDNWTAVSRFGYIAMQGSQVMQTVAGDLDDASETATHRYSPTSAMVCVKNANHILVENCVFTEGGSYGVMEFEQCSHNSYIGNIFTKLASGGICIGNTSVECRWYQMPVGLSAHDRISNNLIDGVACYYMDAVGIMALKVNNVSIDHNELYNLPYCAINIGFEWDDTGTQQSFNNQLFNNKIGRAGQLLDDSGGIYALGKQEGSRMYNNYVFDHIKSTYQGGYSVAAYYLDNGSCHWIVENNVAERVTKYTYAFNPPNHSNTMRNNFYSEIEMIGEMDGYKVWENNIDYTGKPRPKKAQKIILKAGLEAKYSYLK